MEQQGETLDWIGPVLEKTLGTESSILKSFRADELFALHTFAEEFLAGLGLGQDHPDRELMIVAGIYWALAAFLLETDLETSDRGQVIIACRELGHLGSFLIKAKPRTPHGAQVFLRLADAILEARKIHPNSALSKGPAEDLLAIAAIALSKKSTLETLLAADQSSKEKRHGNSR